MKRSLFKLSVMALLIAAMALSMVGCGEKPAETDAIDPEYVAQLEKECVELRNELQALTNQIGDLEQTVVLKSYVLKPLPNEDNTGASVEITAVPMRYQDGQTAMFRVSLDGQEVVATEGNWDGTAYTASVGLEAADGYSYECILKRPDGSESAIVMSSVDAPLFESCVYLQTSLSAYCSLFVDSSALEGQELVLVSGTAQVKLPRIGTHTIDYKSSDLVLKLGEEEQRIPLEIPQGEVEGSYEMVLENIRFNVPENAGSQMMDLWLEVTLTDGQKLSYNGCSWTIENGELIVSAG